MYDKNEANNGQTISRLRFKRTKDGHLVCCRAIKAKSNIVNITILPHETDGFSVIITDAGSGKVVSNSTAPDEERCKRLAKDLLSKLGVNLEQEKHVFKSKQDGETDKNVLKDVTGVEEERVTPGLKVDSGVVKEQAHSGDGNSGTTT